MAKRKPAKTAPGQTPPKSSVVGNPITGSEAASDTGSIEGAKTPRKPRAKPPVKTTPVRSTIHEAEELPEPFTLKELTESYRSLPAADLEPVDDTAPNSPAAPSDSVSSQCANTQREKGTSTQEVNTEGGKQGVVDTSGDPDPQLTPPLETHSSNSDAGDVPLVGAVAGTLDGGDSLGAAIPSRARMQGESRPSYWESMRKTARAAGLPRGQGPGTAYEWATMQAEREYAIEIAQPPEPAVEEEVAVEPEVIEESAAEVAPIIEEPVPAPVSSDQGVPGLGTMPDSWGTLPANASLQVEISWVSANRLRVRDGSGVDLSRALSPAPSYSALSWLETSILFPSKFADISVKATANQDDEKESIRREKLSIQEIRDLLAEMLEE